MLTMIKSIVMDHGCVECNWCFCLITIRDLLSFVFIPLIQKELNIFKDTIWNSHRVRCQKDAQMPKGVPLHLYSFPEKYGAEHCGMGV